MQTARRNTIVRGELHLFQKGKRKAWYWKILVGVTVGGASACVSHHAPCDCGYVAKSSAKAAALKWAGRLNIELFEAKKRYGHANR